MHYNNAVIKYLIYIYIYSFINKAVKFCWILACVFCIISNGIITFKMCWILTIYYFRVSILGANICFGGLLSHLHLTFWPKFACASFSQCALLVDPFWCKKNISWIWRLLSPCFVRSQLVPCQWYILGFIPSLSLSPMPCSLNYKQIILIREVTTKFGLKTITVLFWPGRYTVSTL